MPKHAQKIDKRLQGSWRSDRRRTVAEWRFTRNPTPEKRQRFPDFLGKLRVAYTRTRIRCSFGDSQFTTRYEVLATDSDSVAIRYEDTQVTGRWIIQHIHFEGTERYWIALGLNREWFKREHPT